jgi:hypothetical protein
MQLHQLLAVLKGAGIDAFDTLSKTDHGTGHQGRADLADSGDGSHRHAGLQQHGRQGGRRG